MSAKKTRVGARWALGVAIAIVVVVVVIVGACSDSHRGRGHEDAAGDGGDAPGQSSGRARDGKLPADGPSCLVSQLDSEIAVNDVDQVDMLFVVSNTPSMAEEQAALSAQFPRLIGTLATGDPGRGLETFPPVKSLHLGVVSSDMGAIGVSDVPGCFGLGDDGVMQHEPRGDACGASFPPFLSFDAELNESAQTARDFACIAELGTSGCGFTQPLEAALKALWPASDRRVTFLPDADGSGMLGHGEDTNRGFLRSNPRQSTSLIAVIVVSDSDDCSSVDTGHFRPAAQLDPNRAADASLLAQGMAVRCAFNDDQLYVTSRYINGLKALRPRDEQRVVFAAIVGVPPETVGREALANLVLEDPASREQFYSAIQNHALMQPIVETQGNEDPADDMMRPSCNTVRGTATPPRRIVEVARGFAENGIVQSICQADLGPAIDGIVPLITRQLGAVCLPRPLRRGDDGLLRCDMIWDLPQASLAPSGTPTQCAQGGWEFLRPLSGLEGRRDVRAGARCAVAQLPVIDDAVASNGDGWYYDDFSKDTLRGCQTVPRQRIAFTTSAKPPPGVTVTLRCLDQQLNDSSSGEARCSVGRRSADGSRVGDACLPTRAPENGFDPREAYLETNAASCGGGVCIVNQLDGDLGPGCRPSETQRCPTPAEVERSVYCTCRCDSPEDYAQCACPDGFSCVTALTSGGPELSGGYCMRNDSVATPIP